MPKFFLLVLSCFCLVLFIGCQKELNPLTGNATGNSGGGSVNGGGAGTSFYPLTRDSWWRYKDSLTSLTSDAKVVNKTKTINGIVYTALVPLTGTAPDTGWLAAPRPNYYIMQKGIDPNGRSYNIVFHYLNDTASVGYSWNYVAGNGNGFPASIHATILQKGMSLTVAGKKYNDITHTRLELSYDMLGTVIDFGFYDYFTARGVGIVKIGTNLSAFGTTILQSSTDLIDYSIK